LEIKSWDGQDLSRLNLIKQVQRIENYRGYKLILYINCYPFGHMGYLDDDFFAIETMGKYLSPTEAIDHYLDKTFFHNPALEMDMFLNYRSNKKEIYRPYVNAVRYVHDQIKKEEGK
jgi:hypothetical protein